MKHWQRTREVVLLALAVATVPLLILPAVLDLTSGQESAIFAADIAIWAIFALDFFGGLALADNRRRYLRTHWIDALIVLFPFLRPLRAARALRAGLYGVRALDGINRVTGQPGFRPVMLLGLVALVALALLTTVAESGSSGNINNAGDALWWAFVTATTVGYGDAFPVTTAGRFLGVATMFVGIVVFSTVTAFVTTYLIKAADDRGENLSSLHEKIDRLERLLIGRLGSE